MTAVPDGAGTRPPADPRPPGAGERGAAASPLDRRSFLRGSVALASAALLGHGSRAGAAATLAPAAPAATPPRGLAGPPVPRLRFLTDDPRFVDSRPCVSPDGRTVLFQRAPTGDDPVRTANANTSPWSLWTVPAQGGAAQPFFRDPTLRTTRPEWHGPSGRIVFSGVREGRGGIWTLEADGSGLRAVLPGEPPLDQLFYPSWFPDGTAVAVTDYRTRRLLRVDVATGEREPLTDPGEILAGMCSVSPVPASPLLLAFAGQRPSGEGYEDARNSIWLLDRDGRLRPVDREHGRMPAVAPSAGAVAFMSVRPRPHPRPVLHQRRLPGGIPSIFVAGFGEGGVPPRPVGVTPLDHSATFAKWFPDRRALVCTAGDRAGGRAGIAVVELAPGG